MATHYPATPPLSGERRVRSPSHDLTTQPQRRNRKPEVEHPDSEVSSTALPSHHDRGPQRNQLTPPTTSVDRG